MWRHSGGTASASKERYSFSVTEIKYRHISHAKLITEEDVALQGEEKNKINTAAGKFFTRAQDWRIMIGAEWMGSFVTVWQPGGLTAVRRSNGGWIRLCLCTEPVLLIHHLALFFFLKDFWEHFGRWVLCQQTEGREEGSNITDRIHRVMGDGLLKSTSRPAHTHQVIYEKMTKTNTNYVMKKCANTTITGIFVHLENSEILSIQLAPPRAPVLCPVWADMEKLGSRDHKWQLKLFNLTYKLEKLYR